MDPAGLANYEWTEIANLLTSMWILVGLVMSFAGSMLIAHALIPSLVASYHLPAPIQQTRPLFYGMAIVFFGSALFFVIQIIGLAGVLERFWDDYWI